MQSFRITCDPEAHSFGSTDIIVKSVNAAAQKVGLYDDNGLNVVYDTLCNPHGQNPDAFWCAFELPFCSLILQNAGSKPIFGLSKTNGLMPVYGGYPFNLCNYVTLGVDSDKWTPVKKTKNKDKFVFMTLSESNNRCGYENILNSFAALPLEIKNNSLLYVRDRDGTELFQDYLKEFCAANSINYQYDGRHITDYKEVIKIFEGVDVAICVNHAHTFGMVAMEAMSCGIPLIAMNYSGLYDYCIPELNCLDVKYKLVNLTQQKIEYLTSIGLKNHIPYIHPQYYPGGAFWAEADEKDLTNKFIQCFDNYNLLTRLSNYSRLTAEWFTWERTAINMSVALSDIEKQKNSVYTKQINNRYV